MLSSSQQSLLNKDIAIFYNHALVIPIILAILSIIIILLAIYLVKHYKLLKQSKLTIPIIMGFASIVCLTIGASIIDIDYPVPSNTQITSAHIDANIQSDMHQLPKEQMKLSMEKDLANRTLDDSHMKFVALSHYQSKQINQQHKYITQYKNHIKAPKYDHKIL